MTAKVILLQETSLPGDSEIGNSFNLEGKNSHFNSRGHRKGLAMYFPLEFSLCMNANHDRFQLSSISSDKMIITNVRSKDAGTEFVDTLSTFIHDRSKFHLFMGDWNHVFFNIFFYHTSYSIMCPSDKDRSQHTYSSACKCVLHVSSACKGGAGTAWWVWQNQVSWSCIIIILINTIFRLPSDLVLITLGAYQSNGVPLGTTWAPGVPVMIGPLFFSYCDGRPLISACANIGVDQSNGAPLAARGPWGPHGPLVFLLGPWCLYCDGRPQNFVPGLVWIRAMLHRW